MNQRQQKRVIYYGGGLELVRAFFRDFNIISFPAGTPAVRWAAGSARKSGASRI